MNKEISATLLRGLKVIVHLSESIGPQSLTQISEELNMSTSSVHRFLQTFKMEGFVYQDPHSKMYSLGFTYLNYANKVLADIEIASILNPWLIKLREETKETVGYYLPSGMIRVCVLEHESALEIRSSVGVGQTHPLHLGASGRAILAFQSVRSQEKILATLNKEDRIILEEKLAMTKELGYAINDEEEISTNVGALSVPVFNHRKQVLGSLSVSGPLFRWNKQTMQPFIPMLIETSEQITNSI